MSVVKKMEEAKKMRKKKITAVNRVEGLADDDESDKEEERRKKALFEASGEKKEYVEEPDKKTVLLELFTKSGVAKVQVCKREKECEVEKKSSVIRMSSTMLCLLLFFF